MCQKSATWTHTITTLGMEDSNKCILNSQFLCNYQSLPKVIKDYIDYMGLDFTDCSEITNNGKRCAQAFVFSTPIPGRINEKYTKSCINYAFDNCEKWIIDFVLRLPDSVLFRHKHSGETTKLKIEHTHLRSYGEDDTIQHSFDLSSSMFEFRTDEQKITNADENWFLVLEELLENARTKIDQQFKEITKPPLFINNQSVQDYIRDKCAVKTLQTTIEQIKVEIRKSPVYFRHIFFDSRTITNVDYLHGRFHNRIQHLQNICKDLKNPKAYFEIDTYIRDIYFKENDFILDGFFDKNGKILECWNTRSFTPHTFGCSKIYKREI